MDYSYKKARQIQNLAKTEKKVNKTLRIDKFFLVKLQSHKMENSQERDYFDEIFSQTEDTTEVSNVISSGTQGNISNNVTIDLDALLSDLEKAEAIEAAEAEAEAARENDGQNSTDEMGEGGENPPRKVHWPLKTRPYYDNSKALALVFFGCRTFAFYTFAH